MAYPTLPSGRPRRMVPDGGTPGRYSELLPQGRPALSWVRPSVLWQSRNDVLSRLVDRTAEDREVFVRRLVGDADTAVRAQRLRIRGHEHRERASLLLLGDPGEGDGSQMAVVPGLERIAARGVDAMVVLSDVIYPTGDANDYLAKFAWPYRNIPAPIYAVPGNHDWYDRLSGFVDVFCEEEARLPRRPIRGVLRHPRTALRDLLWRRGADMDPAIRAAVHRLRPRDPAYPSQPAPYWTLDTAGVRFVGIDTGILHTVDAPQGAWLEAVSADPSLPKVLLTGAPLYADGGVFPCPIEGSARTVLDVVRDPAHGYVAAIGGDTHNYQRYPARQPDGRTIQLIVSGGGGAYMHASYGIPLLGTQPRIPGPHPPPVTDVDEVDAHFFPTRGRSLSAFSRRLARKFGVPRLGLSPAEASALLAVHLDRLPVEPEALERMRWASESVRGRLVRRVFLQRLPAPGRWFQRFAAEIASWDDPPMYKSFLRVDVGAGELRIRCYGATGWLADEEDPPLEDEVVIALATP